MEIKDFYITCPLFVEDLAAIEARNLGAIEAHPAKGGVHLRGTLETAYRLCLEARIPSRLFLPLLRFKAEKKEDIYRAAAFFEWKDHMDLSHTFAVNADCRHKAINNDNYAALLVKDGIADYFRGLTHERPGVNTEDPDLQIHLYLDEQEGIISLDLSGQSLHRRGYRLSGGKASLKENLAAAILMRGGWPEEGKNGTPLLDPMCGSGTFLIEGALMAADFPPGLLRQKFGFEKWKQHNEELWSSVYFEALKKKKKAFDHLPPITGYDADPQAVAIARENIENAGLSDHIRVEKRDITEAAPPEGSPPGFLVTNPPYGVRMGEETKIHVLYNILGDSLKKNFQGWKGVILAGDEKLSLSTGLRALKTNTVYNGPLKCVIPHFSITPEYFFKNYNEPEDPYQSDFVNRLKKNLKSRKKWAEKENITSYRLYDADLPEYSAAIDFYENKWITLQEYAPPPTIDPEKAEARLNHIVKVLPGLLELPFQNLFIKQRKRQKGTDQYEKLDSGGEFKIVREGGLKFRVNFEDYLDTGLFLNNRYVREEIRKNARDKHFLNLFSYTATATVYAADGGAASTLSVDTSNTYNDWGKENLLLNHFHPGKHHFIKEDAFTFLKNHRQKYDLIFLDPPTFSNNKKRGIIFDLQRDWLPLVRLCLDRLRPGGMLIFSNNFKKFKLDEQAITERQGITIRDISQETLPDDFQRNAGIHHCWIIEKAPAPEEFRPQRDRHPGTWKPRTGERNLGKEKFTENRKPWRKESPGKDERRKTRDFPGGKPGNERKKPYPGNRWKDKRG